jgi:predicted dehydrogenase
MRLLYYDRWVEAPPPAPLAGCVTVRVLSASTPGLQSEVRAKLGRVEQIAGLLSQSGRLARSTVRHLRTYGVKKTLRSVQSHARHFHLKRLRTLSSVAGVVVDENLVDRPGPIVAGYRYDGPLGADFLTLHPSQFSTVPQGLAVEDAATVFYYAIALAAAERLRELKASVVVVYGTSLHCLILHDLLSQSDCRVVPFSGDQDQLANATRALEAGAFLVVGHSAGREAFSRWIDTERSLYVGIAADQFTAQQWIEREARWIGLPHSEVRNLHISSGLPLETNAALQTTGLARALEHMRSSAIRPASHAAATDVARDCFGQSVDLSVPRVLAFQRSESARVVRTGYVRSIADTRQVRVAAIGLGSWGTETLFPLVGNHPRARIVLGVDRNPLQLQYAAGLLRLPALASDPQEAIANPDVDALFIASRHDSHAELAARALRAGKQVFLEKPLVLDYEQLATLTDAMRVAPKPYLAAGFNRPHWQWTAFLRQKILEVPGPVTVSAIVRELRIPRTHYYNWPQMGTRIVSNGCHWIDFGHHLLGGRTPMSVQAVVCDGNSERAQANNVIVIRYDDGSSVNLAFSDSGDARPLVHEYIDIKTERSHFMIHDFQRLTELRDGTLHQLWRGTGERGWERCVGLAIEGMATGGPPPRPFDELMTSTMLTLEARASYEKNGALRPVGPALVNRVKRAAEAQDGKPHPETAPRTA